MELKNGLYRLVSVSWDSNGHGDNYDYYHAAVETNGRWNAEFFDSSGQSIWVYGREDETAFKWDHHTKLHDSRGWSEKGDPSILVEVKDVVLEEVPYGALCQTLQERGEGIPKHWKSWRIV